jgi:hypothetical protein
MWFHPLFPSRPTARTRPTRASGVRQDGELGMPAGRLQFVRPFGTHCCRPHSQLGEIERVGRAPPMRHYMAIRAEQEEVLFLGILHTLTDRLPVVHVNQFPVLAAVDAEAQVASLARVGLRTASQHDAPVPAAPLDRKVRNELPAPWRFVLVTVSHFALCSLTYLSLVFW